MSLYFEALLKSASKNKKALVESSLKSIASKSGSEDDNSENLGLRVAQYIGSFGTYIQNTFTAIDHIKLLKALYDLLDKHEAVVEAMG